jgi:hypothetical protein
MVRLAVIIWYALAAVFVPKACCCLFHLHAPPKPTAKAVRTAKPVAATAGCPHCRTAGESEQAPGEPTPQKCPCRDGRPAEPAITPSPTVAVEALGTVGPHPAVVSDRPTGPAVAVTRPGAPVRAGPFLTADDLLHAFHILRC